MPNIKWLVQDTARMYSAVEDEFTPLKELGYEVIPFGVIPFTNEMTGLDDVDFSDSIFIVRGGTKVIGMINDGNVSNLPKEFVLKLTDGLFYDKLYFDQAYYSHLGLPLLNDTPMILDLRKNEDLLASFDTPKFVKPSSDLKAFTAGILEPENTLKSFIESQYHRSGYNEEMALVHDLVEIDAEYRFFCIDGKVITGSQYRRNNVTVTSPVVPQAVLDAADEYAVLYKPSEIYTMDLAETPDGIKIVEYNCWHGSGLYDVDTKKLFSSIHEHYINKGL